MNETESRLFSFEILANRSEVGAGKKVQSSDNRQNRLLYTLKINIIYLKVQFNAKNDNAEMAPFFSLCAIRDRTPTRRD